MKQRARIIGAAILVLLTATAAFGCSQKAQEELAYRDSFKKIWDATALTADQSKKRIDAAYEAGDIDAVVAEYKALAVKYDEAKDKLDKLKEPEGYGGFSATAREYLSYGSQYYRKVGAVVEETGGNYNEMQETEIKALEKRWEASTGKIEKEMTAKRFRIS